MAGLIRSAADQEMQRCFRDAERTLRRAADVCVRVAQDNRKAGKDAAESRRALATRREIEQILGRLSAIGHIAPLGGNDPDLIPEAERNRQYREVQAKKREARQPHKVNSNGTEK